VNGDNLSREDDDIDLRTLLLVFWGQRWLIFAVTALFGIGSVVFALRLPAQYTATAILTPVSNSGASALGRIAGQFGGLASLAGISLGGVPEQDKSVLAVELVKTWGFQEQFIRDNHLEVPILAGRRWDQRTGELRIDEKLYDVGDGKWIGKSVAASGEPSGPSGWQLYDAFRRRVSISKDRASGLVTLSVEFYSPVLAKEWVDKLVVAINRHLQEQDQQEAKRSIEYLNRQVQNTSLTEMRTVFYRLIEEQTKTLMLAEVSDEYVLKTLSPAKVPEEKSGPPRALIVGGATLLGAFLGVVMAISVFTMRRNKGSKAGAPRTDQA